MAEQPHLDLDSLTDTVDWTPYLGMRFMKEAVSYFRQRIRWELSRRSLPETTLDERLIEGWAWNLAERWQQYAESALSDGAPDEISADSSYESLSSTLTEIEKDFFVGDETDTSEFEDLVGVKKAAA